MEDVEKTEINSYLSFKLEKELFALNVASVISILEVESITEVPMAPYYMKGVINLRGTVLPIIDIRLKFGLGEITFTSNTCILVLEVKIDTEKAQVGILVDSVEEVKEIIEAEIQPPPTIGAKYKSEFIYGMAKQDNKFFMLLDINKVFSSVEINKLKANQETVIA